MNIWNILKIEQTRDKDALKKAYRMRLSSVNPEDDPKGFMELRSAYEEALKLADQDETDVQKDETLVSSFCVIYNNFETRINPDSWRALFDMDAFVSLDTCEDSFLELLRFFTDHVFIPQKVWQLIVEQFDVQERKKELEEIFPQNFIEYILNNARYDDILNYNCFKNIESVDAETIDSFIRKYFDLDRAVREKNIEKANEAIGELESFSISHPYVEVMKMRLEIQSMHAEFEEKQKDSVDEHKEQQITDQLFAAEYKERIQTLLKNAESLAKESIPDIKILHFCGDLAVMMQDYPTAEMYYNQTKSMNPDNYFVKAKQAEIAFYTGRYKDARDIYLDLLKENHYDNSVRIGMIRANQKMIEENKRLLAENPDDSKVRMEIAWSHYQSYQFQEAIDFLRAFEPEEEQKFEYYNILGRCYLAIDDTEHALKCFLIWKDLIENLPKDDDSEETEKKRKRYCYVNFLISDCYMKTKRYDDARKCLDCALQTDHEEIMLSYEADCELCYRMKQYERCLRACDFLLQKDPRDYIGYIFKAKACYHMNYIQESYNACEQAISLYPYLSDPYAFEIKLFYKTGQTDAIPTVIKRFDQMGIKSDEIDYYRARQLFSDGKIQDAITCLKNITSRSKREQSDMENYDDVYMLLGFCYEQSGEHQLEAECFRQVIRLNPEHPIVYGALGVTYRLLGEYKEAMEMFDKQITLNPTCQSYIDRAILNRALGNYKSALSDFQNAARLDPSNTFAYSRQGLIYEYHRKFGEAEHAYQKALELLPEDAVKDRAEIISYLARLYQCMNRFTDSRQYYEYYIEHFEPSADITYDYSVLLVRMGEIETAIRLLRDAINHLPYDEDLQMCIRRLIEVYGDAGYVDLAHETYEYAMEKNPKDCSACAIMGEVFAQFKLYDDARKMYEKAIELDTGNKENYYSELMECIANRRRLHNITKYIPYATISKEKMYTPHQYIKMARLARVTKNYKQAHEIIDIGLKIKRCMNCFYNRCHEALFQKGLIYEAMRDYSMARMMYEEALRVCGHNAYYEARLKRIQNK